MGIKFGIKSLVLINLKYRSLLEKDKADNLFSQVNRSSGINHGEPQKGSRGFAR